MRIIWLVPPSEGFPNVGQYRFFKRMPIRASIIYPYLAASGVTQLDEAGHYAQFIDAPTMELNWPDTLLRIDVEAPELIIMEARAPMMAELSDAISRIKKHTWKAAQRPIIAVYGDHVSWDPGEGVRAGADVVITGGDYDYGALTLAQSLEKGNIPPQVWQPGLLKDLNQLSWVDRELVDWRPYREAWAERKSFFWLMSSRGCPFRCIYCSWNGTLWESKIRLRDPVNVAREMWSLYSCYGPCEILDDADCFAPSAAIPMIQELEHFGVTEDEIRWGVQTHPALINDLALLKRLKGVGLSLVKLGIETGNQNSLNIMRKGLSIEQSERAIQLLQDAEISVHANMVVGWPWETKEEAYHSIEWIKKLRPNQAQFSLLIPYPNTELYDMAKANGWLTVDPGDYAALDASRPMLKMVGMSSQDVIKLYQDAWRMFYLDPKFIMRKILAVHDLGSIKQLYNGWKSVTKGHMKAVNQ